HALGRVQAHDGTFALLEALGIRRIETDLTPQGVDFADFAGRGVAVSLHYPFGYLTTGRYCAEAAASSGVRALRGVFPCKKECQSRGHTFAEAPAPVPVHMVGNTLFWRTPLDPEGWAKPPVDRLVYSPRPPM
ncbi:MAG: hypothetical protein K8I02_02665, partial [Candidatus Methylomirabilis sp.]|nr:hypothetical protein [Deltaproteobacteria bacterium]